VAEEVVIRFRADTAGLTGPLKAAGGEAKTLNDILSRLGSNKPAPGGILDPDLFRRSAAASAAAAKAYTEQSNGAIKLAGSLGLSYRNAQEFSKALGLSAKSAAEAADRLGSLDTAGANTVEKFKALKNEFGLSARQFRELNGTYEQNTAAQQRLAGALNSSLDGARKFSLYVGLSADKAGAAVSRYRELAAAGATVSDRQRVLTQELGLSAEQFGKIEKVARITTTTLAGITAIAGGIGAAFGAIVQQGIGAFVEFDSQLRTFQVIAEATTEQTAAIREEITKLGTSTTKAPKEIAELSIELSKAGFTAKQVKQSLGGIVLASQATGEGLARTGEVVGNVINQFGLSAKDATRIADLLVVTSNKSAAGTNDLGEALGYVGTAAAQSGQSLESTLLALGQLANSGIKGSAAGTGLAEALRRLKLASANASTELQDLKSKGSKTAVSAFNKIDQSVRGANGQLLPLPQILKNLQGGLEGVSQVDKDLINNALFGVQGGRVIQTLISSNVEQLSLLEDGLSNADGAAKRAGDALSQGPAAAMQRLEAATTTALVRVGELVSGVFLPFIDAGELLVGTFNSLPAPLQAAMVGAAGFAAALAAAAAAMATYRLSNAGARIEQVLAAKQFLIDAGALAIKTAATNASAIAATAAAASQNLLSTTVSRGAIVQGAMAAMQAASAAATTAWSAVTTGSLIPALGSAALGAKAFLVAIAPIALTAGFAIGAIAALGLAFQKSAGAKFADEISANTKKIAELNTALGQRPPTPDYSPFAVSLKVLGDAYSNLTKNIQDRGAIEGLQASLVQLQDAIANTDVDSLKDRFGNEVNGGPFRGFITSSQLGAQKAQLALEQQGVEIGKTIDAVQKIITDKGLSDLKNAPAVRLKIGNEGVKEFVAQSEKAIAGIEEQIASLSAQKGGTEDTAFKQQISDQIVLLEKSKTVLQSRAAALTGDSNALKTAGDTAKEAEEAQNKLADSLKKIEGITKNSEAGKLSGDDAIAQLKAVEAAAGGEVEVRQKTSEAILKIRQSEIAEVQALLSNSEITETEAIARLQEIRSKSGDNPAAAKAAASEILKIRKAQIDAEIALIQAGIAATEALKDSGKIGEAKAAEEISKLKTEEVQKQIQANQEALNQATGAEYNKLVAEEKKLQAELTKIEAAERRRRNEERLKDFDEVLIQQEAARKKGQISDRTFNEYELQIAQQRGEEELRQQKEALGKLEATDVEGREVIAAKIAQIEQKQIESQEKAQAKRLALLKEEQEEAIALVQQAAAERDIATQAAVNQGVLSQEQADKQRLNSRRNALEAELAIAQNLEAEIAQKTATSPDGLKALEREKQQARSRTGQLTLQLLQAESEAQEKLRSEVISGIELQLSRKVRAYDAELAALGQLRQERDRNTKSIEAAGEKELAALGNSERALSRKSQLLSAQVGLRQAIADAAVADTQIELDRAKAAGDPAAAARLETTLAEQKRAALIVQQDGERQALTIENQRAESAAKRAVVEARINELKAKAALLDAQAAQREQAIADKKAISEVEAKLAQAENAAPGEKNQEEVARLRQQLEQAKAQAGQNAANSAQGVDIAQQQVGLAKEASGQALADQANEQNLKALKEQTLEITQATALKQFDAAEAARQLAVNLERAKSAQEGLNAAAGAPAGIPSRRTGGPTPAGVIEAAEEGPELIRYQGGGWGYLPTRGLYNLPAPGIVYTAPQTKKILGKNPPQSAIAQTPPGDRALGQLLKEFQGLAQQLKGIAGTQNNHFSIQAQDDPYRRMAEISAAQQRGRRR
jgi:TP901 family phage tail tape measure protein